MKKKLLPAKTVNRLDLVTLALYAKIWELIKQGRSCYQIGVELEMSTQSVLDIKTQCMQEFTEEINSGVESQMKIDLARLDDMIAHLYPIAKAVRVEVGRHTTKGEPYTDEEWKYSAAAVDGIFKAIKLRSELLGYQKMGDTGPSQINNNTLIWMKSKDEMDFVEKIVKSQPKEITEPESVNLNMELDL